MADHPASHDMSRCSSWESCIATAEPDDIACPFQKLHSFPRLRRLEPNEVPVPFNGKAPVRNRSQIQSWLIPKG